MIYLTHLFAFYILYFISANSTTGSNWHWSTGQILSFNNFDNTTRAGYVIPGKPNCVVIYTGKCKHNLK